MNQSEILNFCPASVGLVAVYKDDEGREYTTPVAGYAMISDHDEPEPFLVPMLIDRTYGLLIRADKESFDRIEWQAPQQASCKCSAG